MANFKKIAERLGLEDVGKATLGERIHESCGAQLRFGKDGEGYIWSYCPKCQKRVVTIFMPRFREIKITPHDD